MVLPLLPGTEKPGEDPMGSKNTSGVIDEHLQHDLAHVIRVETIDKFVIAMQSIAAGGSASSLSEDTRIPEDDSLILTALKETDVLQAFFDYGGKYTLEVLHYPKFVNLTNSILRAVSGMSPSVALVRSDPNLLKVYPDDEGQKPDFVFLPANHPALKGKSWKEYGQKWKQRWTWGDVVSVIEFKGSKKIESESSSTKGE